MKVTAEDLRRHYADLSDDGLLELNRDELMDVARDCYDDEMARRGLSSGQPDDDSPQDDTSEPVAVAIFVQAIDGKQARDILKAAGIPCYLENEHLLELNPLAAAVNGGVRVMVPAPYLERARDVLDQQMPDEAEDTSVEPWDGRTEHRFVETNGIRMHYAEAGAGPLVLLLHGFPESWYAWRHQLGPLAAEGYHVVAPDLRGYGQTDRPETLEAFDIFQLVGDIAGLVNALGEGPAVIVGHDWGAWIAPCAALLRPDLFRAVALLSVPYTPRRDVNETQWEQRKYPGKVFYQAMFRSPGAEQFLSTDIRARLLAGLWTLSGDVAPEQRWQPARDPNAPPSFATPPSGLPPWLTKEDLDYLEGEFMRAGFTGGLNYYRNMDRNWELTPFLDGAKLLQRTLFIAGEKDPVLEFLDAEYEALETNVPNLWKKILIKGAGHWIQQERPAEVNRLLIEFLRNIEAGARAQ